MNTSTSAPKRATPDPGAQAESLDVFSETIAEMTWFEVDAAAKRGAVLLWAFGVIEQHGPHLPTGTDVYLPAARLRRVKRALQEREVEALIVPPYYWGVNVVSGSFPASYRVRPELMRELMADVLCSFERDGFRHAFCFSGHGDAVHNQTIHAGLQLGTQRTGMDLSFVVDPALATRIGIPLDDPNLTLHASGRPGVFSRLDVTGSSPSAPTQDDEAPRYMDVHAGQWETSMMMCTCPALVREDVRTTLVSTDYGMDDLMQWRRGFEHARAKTPLGYFGDPASASREAGQASLNRSVQLAADAIVERLQRQ